MNIFNKKTILFFSLTSLMMNACVSKNEPIVKVTPAKTKVTWAKASKVSTKKEDCIDCYATPIDYAKAPTSSNNLFAKNDKVLNTKHFGAYAYTETASDVAIKRNSYRKTNSYIKVTPAIARVNTSYGSYALKGNVAIQVGAFRKHDGAETFSRKYNALSDNYKVAIKTVSKNNKPLYRVRIEGFSTKAEAKKFMYSYGISEGFLVRK